MCLSEGCLSKRHDIGRGNEHCLFALYRDIFFMLKGPVAKLSLTVRLQKQQDKCKQQIVFHVDAQEFGDITYAVVDY